MFKITIMQSSFYKTDNADRSLQVLQGNSTVSRGRNYCTCWDVSLILLYVLLKYPNISQLGSHKQHFATSNWSPQA